MPSGLMVWGIDVGQCALKAIKLRDIGDGRVEAVAFDVVEHAKILSQPDADRDELISTALKTFVERNACAGDKFVVGVPGQQTFARFCKMPPIDLKKDAKKIHDLVRYEASQQIPFDIDDVVWDYQVFTAEGSPDIEVGIFAIRKDLIRKHLGYFNAVRIVPAGVQTVPAALYNFCRFDGQAAEGGATVVIDVGAQNTDLIIAEPNSAWTRNIPLGGNSFTEALVRSFKLSFAKAESFKRGAAESKYARQIFQAMRPVFADIVAEIQRSLGFYSSTHRDVELRRVVALGNAFRLPGLQKYLENNLTIGQGVTKLEKFNRLVLAPGLNATQFQENVLSFGAAYGLALQGLGLAQIHASLLPTELLRISVWERKRPYFIATAASLAMAAAVPYVANALDWQTLHSSGATQARSQIDQIIRRANDLKKSYAEAKTDTGKREEDIKNLLKLQEHKSVLPRILVMANEAMPPIQPPELAQVSSLEEFKKKIESDPRKFDRTRRGQLIIESLQIEYVPDIAQADPTPEGASAGGERAVVSGGGVPAGGGRGGGPTRGGGGRGDPGAMVQQTVVVQQPPAGGGQAGFLVRVQGRLLYGKTQPEAVGWLEREYFPRLREIGARPGQGVMIPPEDPKQPDKRSIGAPYVVKLHGPTGTYASAGMQPSTNDPKGVQVPDPLTGEETANDWRVSFAFKVKLGEGPVAGGSAAQPAQPAQPAPEPAAPPVGRVGR